MNTHRLMPVALLPAIKDAIVETGGCFQPESLWAAIITAFDQVQPPLSHDHPLLAAQREALGIAHDAARPAPIQSGDLLPLPKADCYYVKDGEWDREYNTVEEFSGGRRNGVALYTASQVYDYGTAIRALASTPSAAVKAPEGYTQVWLKESPDTTYIGFDIGLNFTPAGRLLDLSGCTITTIPSAAMQGQGVPDAWLVSGPYQRDVFTMHSTAVAWCNGLNKGFGENAYTITPLVAVAPTPTVAQPQAGCREDWKTQLYAAQDAAMALREYGPRDADGQRQGIVVDDTQVGLEFAMEWFEKNMLGAAQPQAGGRELTDADIDYIADEHDLYSIQDGGRVSGDNLKEFARAVAAHITGTKGATE